MRMSVKGPVPMNERQPLTDKRLEDELRGLPELDPPAHLLSRVMEHVEAMEGQMAPELGAGISPEPMRRIPMWQPAAAVVAFAALIVFVTIRHAATSVELLRNGVALATQAARFVSDSLVGIITGAWGWVAKGAVLASVLGRVVRTVVTAAMADYGPFIVVMVVVAVGLQLALLAVAGRRPEVS